MSPRLVLEDVEPSEADTEKLVARATELKSSLEYCAPEVILVTIFSALTDAFRQGRRSAK